MEQTVSKKRGLAPVLIRGPVLFFLLASGFLQLMALDAYGTEFELPDSGVVRHSLEALFTLPLNKLQKEKKERIINDPSGTIKLQIDTGFSDHVEFRLLYGEGKKYAMDVPGSVVLHRATSSGRYTLMRISLCQNPWIYMEIEPDGNRSLISVFMGEGRAVLYRHIRISLSLERMSRIPLEDIRNMTAARMDWELILARPNPSYFESVRSMVAAIRAALPGLPDADDGAMDEEGRFVGIESLEPGAKPGLNCSGFAKWIADGLYKPLAGRYLSIERLKEKNKADRGSTFASGYEEDRDPYFGLDWIRNIAVALHEARMGRTPRSSQDRDVGNLDFVETIEDKGIASEDLDLALYVLARQEPGNFYMASVNGKWGKDPVLWQHYHVVVLFPWFDTKGNLKTAVFERNVESSLGSLHKRYPKEYFHLVRIKASGDFIPPTIP